MEQIKFQMKNSFNRHKIPFQFVKFEVINGRAYNSIVSTSLS